MTEILGFFRAYEATIYFGLGVGIIIYGYRFVLAWDEARQALFGLERTSAQKRLSRAAGAMFFLLAIGFAVFLIVTFSPEIEETVDTMIPTQAVVEGTEIPVTTDPNAALATATPLPTVSVSSEGCKEGELEITFPQPGQAISGEVEVVGTVDVPDFGFFKFEVAEASQALWLTIQAGRTIIQDGPLVENWDTSLLPPGNYVLRLLVTLSDGDELPACHVPVVIGRP